ncbi:MAG: uroporphyrinogen decarboxylase family protein [Bacteroidales bacterium]
MAGYAVMNGRERMARAMVPGRALSDRVPVLCQLALGHYFLNAGRDAVDVWHDSEAFAAALVTMQRRYRFDGILVNLPGRDPRWREQVDRVEPSHGRRIIRWRGPYDTIVPPDDNPRVCERESGRARTVSFDTVDPDRLFYVEPHDLAGVSYPTAWGFDAQPAEPGPSFFPPWHWRTLELVRTLAPDVSVHGEVFSPFSQLVELVGISEAMAALLLQPAKVAACLERLVEGTVVLARGHLSAGADAVLVSSAYAGGGFLSRDHYSKFVLPFERAVVEAIKTAAPGAIVYTHTCGAIGDRLDLMEATGIDGIDTLDPPPLGNVDLRTARQQLGGRLFIKGNVNPVDTVLNGDAATCYRDGCERMAIAKPGGRYILSTACSVPPHAPPENILALTRAAEDHGKY